MELDLTEQLLETKDGTVLCQTDTEKFNSMKLNSMESKT